MKDPLAGTAWSAPGTVSGFARAAPNEVLLGFARAEQQRGAARVLDLGCGAARNALPLAHLGLHVTGTDLSWPMLCAAAERAAKDERGGALSLMLASMDRLPVQDRSMDLVVAHGVWNLASSAAEFRRAVREAARVARPHAGLFVFTFSRNTLAPEAQPVPGESFVFTEFSGQPQCFLTELQLKAELGSAGFVLDRAVPLTEHNRPGPGSLRAGGPPVIYEAAFRRCA